MFRITYVLLECSGWLQVSGVLSGFRAFYEVPWAFQVVLWWFCTGRKETKKRKPEVAHANESQQPKWSTDARLQNDL